MPIFIAKTYDGLTESVVLAESYKLAVVYWQGQGVYPCFVDEKSEDDLKDHLTGVLPIVKTERRKIPGYGPDAREYLLVSYEK